MEAVSPVIPPISSPVASYDVAKLCKAIGMHETHDCKDRGAGDVNNCIGVKPGGKFRQYATKEDSYKDCERIWSTYYKKFPDQRLAAKWSAGDGKQWLENVKFYYNK